ncbi:glycerol-3-phosphate acyltransferase [Candidatus Hodarchaeum mangrovi]
MFEVFLSGLLGYFCGSVFISYYWAKIRGINLTEEGTGQLGATNAGRLLGWPALIIVGLFDIGKAIFALGLIDYVFRIIIQLQNIEGHIAIASVGILLGHINSFWIWIEQHKWHGGKGGAPLGGILFFISWQSFFLLYIGLMTVMQLVKKFITKNKTYDNFLTNSILFLFIPPVLFFNTYNFLYFSLIIFLELIVVYSEKEKVLALFSRFKQTKI